MYKLRIFCDSLCYNLAGWMTCYLLTTAISFLAFPAPCILSPAHPHMDSGAKTSRLMLVANNLKVVHATCHVAFRNVSEQVL